MRHLLVSAALIAAASAGATHAQTAGNYTPATRALLASAKFKAAQQSLDHDYDRIVRDVVTLTEIESPPFKETQRGKAYMAMLQAEGLKDVEMDEVGNVMGLRPGTGGGPLIVVASHLDTVFPAGTNVKVRREGNSLYAPGIGDDTSSLPVLLAFIRAMKAANFTTKADILFMGDVGEEGAGDLRGMRYLFNKGRYANRIKYFISFEPGRADRITNGGTGSKRYKVTYTGPGGHSFGAFGLVSPAYALGNAIAELGKMKVPVTSKTTYNVGLIEGGTSVNAIPFAMSMTVDMRSNGKAELDAEEQEFLSILPRAAAQENAARFTASGKIAYEAKMIGDRPVGHTPDSAEIVQIATAVAQASGFTPKYGSGSSDSNIPMSKGIQALTLGGGFSTFRAHSLDEGMTLDRPADLASMASGLATVLLLAGGK